jgi:hypothetical protein
MAQKYFVVYGQDEDANVLYFVCEGLEELLFELSELARELPDVSTVGDWLANFIVFPHGTNAEKAAARCALFIIEGQPGDADPVFDDDDEDEMDAEDEPT